MLTSLIIRRRLAAMYVRGGALALISVVGLAAHAQPAKEASAADQSPAYFHNTLPSEAESDGTVTYRIVGGMMAHPGAWPSMAPIYNRKFAEGRTPFCGAAIIDTNWALTAAHCVYQREAKDLFVRENTNLAGEGHQIDVTGIIINENYSPHPPLNDVALLQLAEPAQSPRQLLMRSQLGHELLKEGALLTVIGYGLVTAQPVDKPEKFNTGSPSGHLLQVDIPLISHEQCIKTYGAASITDATICVGTREGGTDSCQGDSGGPLYVHDRMQQPVQVGVVSWGEGCAQPGKYGVYASVGYFEKWIRLHVPNASFVAAAEGSGGENETEQIAAAYVKPSAPVEPSQLGQVNVDILPGERVRVGERITVRVTSSVPGHLFVFNEDHDGNAYQIFPNRFTGHDLPGQARTKISAGQVVTLPGPTDGFALRIAPPTGKNRLIALVVPGEARTDDLAQKNEDMRPIANLSQLLGNIVERDLSVDTADAENRAVSIREYEIIK